MIANYTNRNCVCAPWNIAKREGKDSGIGRRRGRSKRTWLTFAKHLSAGNQKIRMLPLAHSIVSKQMWNHVSLLRVLHWRNPVSPRVWWFPFAGGPVIILRRLGLCPRTGIQYGQGLWMSVAWIELENFQVPLWSLYYLIIQQFLFFDCILTYLALQKCFIHLWQ